MIITRSPLRISLGGGGTDLPSYYQNHGGFLVAAAIDKYVYITLHRTFGEEFLIKYSRMEKVKTVDEVEHPIIRESLRHLGITKAMELASMADIPAGTGLGSSGSFTTALLKVLHTHKRNLLHPSDLAEQACHIELDLLKEPIGKQDQYIAAYGGITCFEFHKDGKVSAWPLRLHDETIFDLEDNLLLFFTGYSRSASQILKEQDVKSKDALEQGDLHEFARLMDVHWQNKKKRSGGMSNPKINEWYDYAMEHGALGGKLIGAGGGGFLMFYAADRAKLRTAMREKGLTEVRFRFDFEGTKVVASE